VVRVVALKGVICIRNSAGSSNSTPGSQGIAQCILTRVSRQFALYLYICCTAQPQAVTHNMPQDWTKAVRHFVYVVYLLTCHDTIHTQASIHATEVRVCWLGHMHLQQAAAGTTTSATPTCKLCLKTQTCSAATHSQSLHC
jgi:hypothetical protein